MVDPIRGDTSETPGTPAPDDVAGVPWHARDQAALLASLGCTRQGLSPDEVRSRRQVFGENIVPRRGRPRLITLYLAQFKSPFIYLLFAARALSILIGEFLDAAFIFIVLQANAVIGTFQEWKAASEAEQLRSLAFTEAIVGRGGHRVRIDSAVQRIRIRNIRSVGAYSS